MVDILQEVLKHLPDSAKIAELGFEGANIVLYTKNREFFINNEGIIKQIVDTIKKRVELRCDPAITMDQEEAEAAIKKIIPEDAGADNITFDPQRSRVIIEAEKPGIAIGKSGEVLKEIKKVTLWTPSIRRTPAIRSKIIENIRHVLYENNDYRKKFLDGVGRRIYGGWTTEKKQEWVRLSFLGGAREVGRSCILLQTPESKVLLDCGINVAGTDSDAYPVLDAPEFDIKKLDAVICSHAHLDHCLPPDSLVLTESGYKKIDDLIPGENVISLDWKSGRYIKNKITEKTKTTGHKKVISIKTCYSSVEASPNHRFFVVENMKVKEIYADQLNKGMLLPSNILHKELPNVETVMLDTDIEYKGNNKEAKLPSELNDGLAEFIGYYMGDGHKSSKFSLRLTDNSLQILEHHKELVYTLFNHNSKIRHHSDKTKNASILEINNVKIIRFLEKNFPEMFSYSNSISIPSKIFNSPLSVQRAFIRGFSDADGTVTKIIKLTSFSEKMLIGLQHLFSLNKIPANIKSDNSICLNSMYSINEFHKKIGFSHIKKQSKLINKVKGFSKPDFIKQDLIPLTRKDFRRILKDAGMVGRVHSSPNLSNRLPSSLLDLFRRNEGYITRKTAYRLIEFLEERISELEAAKQNTDLYGLRQLLTIRREDISSSTGLMIHEIQQLEEGRQVAALQILSGFIFNKLNEAIANITENIKSIKAILSLQVTWERINNIKVNDNPYPYLVDIETESHNFIAHNIVVHNSGFIPFLYKMGFRGPTYCTAPTRDISALLALDYISVAAKEAKKGIYSSTDVKEMVKHTICLDFGEVTDITPDLRMTLYNSGHVLGSAQTHIHIGNGLHNFLYTGDMKFAKTRLLDEADTSFPRLDTVLVEATYGSKDDILQSRKEAEDDLLKAIKDAIARGGKVLIPVLGVGRAQEVMVIVHDAIKRGLLDKIPVYVQGMVWDVTAIHTAYPDFLNRDIKKAIFHRDQNPFLDPIFKRVAGMKEQKEVIEEVGPCLILATSGMMQGGASVTYFKELADNPKNMLVLVSYQGKNTLGHRVQAGEKEIMVSGNNSKPEVIKVNLEIRRIEGLTGHSTRNQLTSFIYNLDPKPKRVITNHGESSKCLDLASTIHKLNKIETNAPKVLESLRIK